jgi:hypothetical protein
MLKFYKNNNISIFINRLNIRVNLIKFFISLIYIIKANKAYFLIITLIKLSER